MRWNCAHLATILSSILCGFGLGGCSGGDQPTAPPAAQSAAAPAARASQSSELPAPEKKSLASPKEKSLGEDEQALVQRQPETAKNEPLAKEPARPTAPIGPATVGDAVKLLDLRTIPRLSEQSVDEVEATNVSYASKEPVAAVYDHHRNDLVGKGWQEISPNQAASLPDDLLIRLYSKHGFYLYLMVNGGFEGRSFVDLKHLGNVSARSLPHFPGAEEQGVSDVHGSSYVTAEKLPAVLDYCRRAMKEAGWHEFQYTGMVSPMPYDSKNSKSIAFQQNAVSCYLSVHASPDVYQGKTVVSYQMTGLLEHDVPLADDADHLTLQQDLWQVDYRTRKPVRSVAQMYRDQYRKLGWKEHEDDGAIRDDFARLVFEGNDELGFMIDIEDDAERGTEVDIDLVSFAESPASDEVAESDTPASPSVPASPEVTVTPESIEAMKRQLLEQAPPELRDQITAELEKAERVMAEATRQALEGDEREATVSDEPSPRAMPREAEVATAETQASGEEEAEPGHTKATAPDTERLSNRCVVTLGERTVEFTHVAAYETKELDEPATAIMMSEKPIPLEKLRKLLAKEDFSKFDLYEFEFPQQLSVTMTEDFCSVFCYIDGASISLSSSDIESTVRTADGRARGHVRMPEPHEMFGKPFQFDLTVDTELLIPSMSPDQPMSDDEVVFDDAYELPLPVGASDAMQTRTVCRSAVEARHEKDLAELVALYRAELPKRNWRELADRAKIGPQHAVLAFAGDQGELQLKLRREGDETMLAVALRDTQKAKANGLLPQPGKARLILGNAHSQGATIVINGKPHSVAAGVGADDPSDAIALNLTPGAYTVVVKVQGEADQKEEFELGADETWGVIVVPTGGFFADQMY